MAYKNMRTLTDKFTIASASDAEVPTGGSRGEGYYSFTPIANPDRDQTTIRLGLNLKRSCRDSGARRTKQIFCLPARE